MFETLTEYIINIPTSTKIAKIQFLTSVKMTYQKSGTRDLGHLQMVTGTPKCLGGTRDL